MVDLDNNGAVVPGIARAIIICVLTILLGVVVGVSGYWAGYVTEGAQRSAINETKVEGLVKNLDNMNTDLKSELQYIVSKLDKLIQANSKNPQP